MSFNRDTILKMDLGEMVQREQQRIRKQEEQKPQQVAAASQAAYERGFRSAFAEANRQADLRKLAASDPAAFFFLTANTRLDRT